MAKVSVSTTLQAPADRIWELIGGWNALPAWHPGVTSSELEQGGRLRRVRLADGSEITERLEKFDNAGRTYSYSIAGGPLPLLNYRSTITVDHDGERATVNWSSWFQPMGAPEEELVETLESFYREGFDNLRRLLGIQPEQS